MENITDDLIKEYKSIIGYAGNDVKDREWTFIQMLKEKGFAFIKGECKYEDLRQYLIYVYEGKSKLYARELSMLELMPKLCDKIIMINKDVNIDKWKKYAESMRKTSALGKIKRLIKH